MNTLTALLSIVSLASAQSTSTYSQSDVPTGTVIPGDYDGALRPQVHFSPPQGFMNDPNGMFVDDKGVYHLYYQCKSMSMTLSKHLHADISSR
jgi:beta-fructofuranosidase